MKNYLLSHEDAWNLESSMFVIEGTWETGYLLDDDLLMMLGLENPVEVGAYCDWCVEWYPDTIKNNVVLQTNITKGFHKAIAFEVQRMEELNLHYIKFPESNQGFFLGEYPEGFYLGSVGYTE